MDLPDCAHCKAAGTLSVVYAEMGVRFCECSCCTKLTRVDHADVAEKVEPVRDVRDCQGVVMYGDY